MENFPYSHSNKNDNNYRINTESNTKATPSKKDSINNNANNTNAQQIRISKLILNLLTCFN